MNGTIAIRKLTTFDIDLLVTISVSTFVDAFAHQNDPKDFNLYIHQSFSKNQLLSELNDPGAEFYFLYYENKIAGYFKINLGINEHHWKETSMVELQRLYIGKDYQGRQMGQFAIDFLIKRLKERNYQCIWLGVWEHNLGAIKFYTRLGFVKTGSHDFMMGNDPQTDYIMKLSL